MKNSLLYFLKFLREFGYLAMDDILGYLGLAEGVEQTKEGLNFGNTFFLSLMCLLIFSILAYFWIISRSKIKANNKDGSGLIYLAFTYLLYFILGMVAVFSDQGQVVHHISSTELVLSGLISFCILSSLSFFSMGAQKIDKVVSTRAWNNGIKYIGFGWVIAIVIATDTIGVGAIKYVDIFLSVISIAMLGYFVTRYFFHRKMGFLGLLAGAYFGIFLLLQIFQPAGEGEGKFHHINSLMLGPSIALSVIVLAYTFNWINELNFYELSNIWVSKDSDPNVSPQEAYTKLTQDANRDTWLEKIGNDKIEKVIEEMIILKRHKNESLEEILNIASRNTRNNNNHLKAIITYDDYQLNRNKVSNALITLVRS